MPGKSLTVLDFLVQDIQVCMDVSYIEKIVPLPLLEPIPAAPIYLVGLMNLANKCVPIIDLALSMGMTRENTYPLDIPILLCSDGDRKMGLIVDKILKLDELDEHKIEKYDESAKTNLPFKGVLAKKKQVLLLLNMSWVFKLTLT